MRKHTERSLPYDAYLSLSGGRGCGWGIQRPRLLPQVGNFSVTGPVDQFSCIQRFGAPDTRVMPDTET